MGCDMIRGMDCTILFFVIVVLLLFVDTDRIGD